MTTQQHRSGFATFVGRPNAGKSTLMNAIVGTKLAITSDRPQTTRRTIRGIVSREDSQLIIVDTPGMHRPRTLLGERLNDQVHETLSDVDVIGLCLPAGEDIGPGDRFIAEQIAKSKATKFAIITKTDAVNPDRVAEQLMQAQRDQMRNHPFPGEHKVPHFYPLPSNYLSQLEMQMQHAPPKKKS